ncbi:ribonuclease H-like domain-containing protein [Desarmillaria tabescens]|uniref:ribonuclease H n=1 Tax=Armillaria tabescens TaxID=1929756 RepID=A0AA39NIP5_ARMTA|nr:ribonuclease H-like domain-containing protein [Desarmillaria tabescens]KAK0466325.1 ribonuclease H-like domain-containing protein [Desarmillaria tabescens]
MAKGPAFYAVRVGRSPGIYSTWYILMTQLEQIKGFPGAKYKKLPTAQLAQEFITGTSGGSTNIVPSSAQTTSTATNGSKSVPSTSDTSQVANIPGEITVFSDGACKGNGKTGAVAGVGVWWGHNDPRNLAERCPGKQTNNRAELIAIVRVLEQSQTETNPLRIKTDSRYSINCVTQWLQKWVVNDFMTAKGTPVENAPLIRYLARLLERSDRLGRKINLEYVQGHMGIEGNEAADRQANIGATLPEVPERNWENLEKVLTNKMNTELKNMKRRSEQPATPSRKENPIPKPVQQSSPMKTTTTTPAPRLTEEVSTS